jgi:Flp pilus assembly protein protease CpaA
LVLWLCFAPLLALLALAALTDLRERRIPNWLTGGVAALYPGYVLLSPAPVAWLAALALAAGVLGVGVALFARQLIGGGDVKLIAALSLWAGPEQFVLFALVTTLVGGVLALITLISLWSHPWALLLRAQLAVWGRRFAPAQEPALGSGAVGASITQAGPAQAPPRATLPYGIAIAAGGFAVVIELMKL